jgi:heme/copper-type cytochrome/quinol oxidase subunit 4
METTRLITQIVGPVLLLRAVSILIDRAHFVEMARGVEREITTVAFSLFPIALMMTGIALAQLHTDRSSPAAVLIAVMAWGAILKASGLILFPRVMAAKARALERAGFLSVVVAVCVLVGGYFTWFGYLAF